MRPRAWRLLPLLSLLLPGAMAACGGEPPESSVDADPGPPPDAHPPLGAVKIMTWNLKEFPIAGAQTVDAVRGVLAAELPDVVAVQEIVDAAAFEGMVAGLPGYEVFVSSQFADDPTMLSVGLVYRRDRFVIDGEARLLFTSDTYNFPRAPIEVRLVGLSPPEAPFDFNLIVVHLKAGQTADDFDRRRTAAVKLDAHIDTRVAGGDDPDYVIAGDFNGEIGGTASANAFAAFLTDPGRYRFLTAEAVAAGDATFPSWGSFIDHIVVTTDLLDEYGAGTTVPRRLDDQIPGYLDDVSDHRPVVSRWLGLP